MSNLRHLDWSKIVDKLCKFATSQIAKETLSQISPLSSPQIAKDSIADIFSAQEVLATGQRPFMESLDLYSTWSARLEKRATLTTLELKDIRHFCMETLALSEVLKICESNWAADKLLTMMDATEILSAIDQIMTPDGSIKSDASEALYKLTNEKKSQVQHVQKILDRLIKTHEMEPILQDRYVTNREGRWVLPVRSGMQNKFEGIIHASSHSKQTVFMEPQEIIPINNRLRQVEVEIEEEIERLLTDLSHYLTLQVDHFNSTKNTLLDCDVLFSRAQISNTLQASTFEFVDDEIELIELRNPVLVLNNENVIANNVHLAGKKRILLLSGPNAGGKTVLLKSIGLAVHMARCGLPICTAPGSKVPFFSAFHVAIGDSQSVDAHLSTFAAHLKVLTEASKAKGSSTLLLIDEICGSTDPEEGSALARSFINEYDKNEVYAVITSHLGALKKGWDEAKGIVNGSLEFDKEKGPTYQFLMGVPGQSLAIQTARRVGVDKNIIEQAMSFLTPEHRKYQENLEEAEQIKVELSKIRDELNKEKKTVRLEKEKYEKLQQELEANKEKLLSNVLKDAEQKVEKLITQAKVEKTFRKHEVLQEIKHEMPEVIKAPAAGQQEQTFQVSNADEFTKKFPPGSKVFVKQVGADAVVQGRPNNKGDVPILSNSMRLMVQWSDLSPPQKSTNPTQELLRKTSHYSSSPADADRLVDLRGLNIDEATARLETQLDAAVLNGEDRIKLVHGHGTETLKRSVRSYLSRSLYVKKWKAGTPATGGDGITWVELKG